MSKWRTLLASDYPLLRNLTLDRQLERRYRAFLFRAASSSADQARGKPRSPPLDTPLPPRSGMSFGHTLARGGNPGRKPGAGPSRSVPRRGLRRGLTTFWRTYRESHLPTRRLSCGHDSRLHFFVFPDATDFRAWHSGSNVWPPGRQTWCFVSASPTQRAGSDRDDVARLGIYR